MHAILFDSTKRRPRSAPDIVWARLPSVELFDDDQRYHDVGVTKAREAVGVANEDGCVENCSVSNTSFAVFLL
jgi:hypothetical protein